MKDCPNVDKLRPFYGDTTMYFSFASVSNGQLVAEYYGQTNDLKNQLGIGIQIDTDDSNCVFGRYMSLDNLLDQISQDQITHLDVYDQIHGEYVKRLCQEQT